MFETSKTCVEYDAHAAPKFSLLNDMYVEKGDKSDWDLLHHLHYKTEGQPFGPSYYKLTLYGETIGVLVLTMPKGLLKERHVMFKSFKPGSDSKAANTARYKLINSQRRVVGRIVLDTLYRGVGASYRFQNLAARMSCFQCVEIQSAMSKFNPFAAKAGFLFAKPMRSNKYEVGLRFFMETFRSHPADTAALIEEINNLREPFKSARIAAVRKFYYMHSAQEKTGNARGNGTSRVDAMSVEDLIRNLQQLILSSPLYGVYINPEFPGPGKIRDDMPTRLPLSAFDNQATDEPLVLS